MRPNRYFLNLATYYLIVILAITISTQKSYAEEAISTELKETKANVEPAKPTNEKLNPKIEINKGKQSQTPEGPTFFDRAKSLFGLGATDGSDTPATELPSDFKISTYQIKEIIPTEKLLYITNLSENKFESSKEFYVFIRSIKSICKTNIISIDKKRALLSGHACPYFSEILVGDRVLYSTDPTASKWKPEIGESYIALSIASNTTTIDVAGVDQSGSALNIGIKFHSQLGESTLGLFEHEFGKNSLNEATTTSGDYVGQSLSYAGVFYHVPDNYRVNANKFTLIPLVGWHGMIIEENGHPSTYFSGSGISAGMILKMPDIKSIVDMTFNYCLLGCHLSESSSSSTAIYDSPSFLSFKASINSEILPWKRWGLFGSVSYLSLASSSAYVNSETASPRSYSKADLNFKIGISRAW